MAAAYSASSGSAEASLKPSAPIKTEPIDDLHLEHRSDDKSSCFTVEGIKSEVLAEEQRYMDHEITETTVIGPAVATCTEPGRCEPLMPCRVSIRDARRELQCARCDQWSMTAAALQHHKLTCSSTGTEPDSKKASDVLASNEAIDPHTDVHKGQKASDLPVTFVCDCEEIFTKSSTLTKQKRNKLPTKSTLTNRGEKLFNCSVCQKGFKHEKDLIKHSLIHNIEYFSCDICKKKFSDESNLRVHMNINHKENKLVACEVRAEKSTNEDKNLIIYSRVCKISKIACNICNEEFLTKNQLKDHSHIHDKEKPYACNVCGSRFTCQNKMSQHLLTHSEDKLYVCEICKKQCKTKSYLNVHKLIHSGVKFACEICDSKFGSKHILNRHIRMKHTPGAKRQVKKDSALYICDVCNNKYKRRDKLIEHMCTHSGQYPYTCKICQKSSTSKYKFKKHSLIHNRAKLACHLCDRTFNAKGCLATHIRMHRKKPYGCEICYTRFSSINYYNLHINDHIGAKPFGCDWESCGMWFTRKYHLIKHQTEVHNGIKPSPCTCDTCGKTFPGKSNIILHLRRGCKGKVIACEDCDITFRTKYCLKKHISLVHKKVRK